MENPLFKITGFKAGSYIILEGERKPSSQFFIIKDGKVSLKKSLSFGNEITDEIIGPGDFFGVVSAMSQYPQIETAVAATNVNLISVSYNRFGELIQKNAILAMKIIRFFSKKLREFDQGQAKVGAIKSSNTEDLGVLFSMAESYFEQGNIESAVYLYQSYLKYSPTGQESKNCKDKLKMLGRPIEPIAINKSSREYLQDQMIFSENEPGNDLFILQKGKVKITKIIQGIDTILNIMKPGDVFGEMALLDNKPRSASAIAMEHSELLAINKSNFEKMVETQPQLMSKIVTVLSERVWNAYKKISNSLLEDVNGKIADTLLTQVERARIKIGPKIEFDFKLSVFDLLKMLGLSDRETQTVLKFMNSNKFMKLDGENIICLDLALLDRLVHFHKEGKVRI